MELTQNQILLIVVILVVALFILLSRNNIVPSLIKRVSPLDNITEDKVIAYNKLDSTPDPFSTGDQRPITIPKSNLLLGDPNSLLAKGYSDDGQSFVPQEDGVYSFNLMMSINSPNSVGARQINLIQKLYNKTLFWVSNVPGMEFDQHLNLNVTMTLNKGDFVQWLFLQTSGVDISVVGGDTKIVITKIL